MLRVWVCLVTLGLLPTAAFAAEIKKINEKSGAVLIDEGKETGFMKGKKVCIYDGEKKVACGKVVKAANKKALVRVSKKKIDLLKTGFVVSLVDEDTKAEPKKEAAAAVVSPYTMSITLNVHFLPMTPSGYSQLEYVPSASGNTSFWNSDGTASSILIPPGFGLEFEMIKWRLLIGARYGKFPSWSQNNTNAFSNANLVMNTSITATDLGVYLDYIYYKRWHIDFAAGLDIDMTSLTMNATQTDSSGATAGIDAYDATSSLTTFSLRLPFIYKYAFGHFGLSLALDLLVPLYAAGPNQSVSVAPDVSGATVGTSATTGTIVSPDDSIDLLNSLNQKKSSFAADIVFGVFFQF